MLEVWLIVTSVAGAVFGLCLSLRRAIRNVAGNFAREEEELKAERWKTF